MANSERGTTLVEALVALAIVGLTMAGVASSMGTQVQANNRSEERSGAVIAAQQVMDALRFVDPSGLPESGESAAQLISVGNLEYEVTTFYCRLEDLCDDESRHLVVEVERGGRKVYDIETVYTQLR